MVTASAISYQLVWSRRSALVGWLLLSCGSHHVVPGAGAGAGAGGLAGQLRGVLLLSEGLLLVPGAAVLTSHPAHPLLVVAFLFKSGALLHVELANANLDSRVAGDVATPSHQLLVLILLGQKRSLRILRLLTKHLDGHQHRFLVRRRAWGLTVLSWVRFFWQLGHWDSVWLAHLWNGRRSNLGWVFRVRRRWRWGVTYHLFIVRKLAVVPKPCEEAKNKNFKN